MTSRRISLILVGIIGLAGITGAFAAAGLVPSDMNDGAGAGDVPSSQQTENPAPTEEDDRSSDADPAGEHTMIVSTSKSLTVTALEGQVIRGKTSLDPGTDLTVRALSENSSQPFLKSNETVVEEDGTFRVTFNFSKIKPGIKFRTEVHRNGQVLANRTAEVTAPPDNSASLNYEGSRLFLQSTTEEEVEGSTDIQPGSEIAVRIHGSGDQAFLKQRTATVTENGSFAVTFDLSDIEEGVTFRVAVRHDGERLTYATGEIFHPE